jgi:5-methylcytosine-specific restriction endonuclease McrA
MYQRDNGAYRGVGERNMKRKSELAVLKKKLWELCKQITRARYGNACYTCGARNLEGSGWQTGHFITDSVCSTALSYDLDNLRPQCYSCNIHRSGNWIAFEKNLTRDHGKKWVENLKKRNEATVGLKYDILWYRKKVAEYERVLSGLEP